MPLERAFIDSLLSDPIILNADRNLQKHFVTK